MVLRSVITLEFRFKLVSLLVCKFGKNFWVSFSQLIANSDFWLFWLETIISQLTWYGIKLLVAKFSRAWKKQGFSLQSLKASLFSLPACHDHSDITITVPKPFPMQWHDFIPHTLQPPCCTHTELAFCTSGCLSLYGHWDCVGSEHCNILISHSALSSLFVDKRAVGGGKSTVVWRHLENTTKNTKTVRTFAVWMCYSKSCFGISLELK